jgi:ferrous-iron efflux pump FieF
MVDSVPDTSPKSTPMKFAAIASAILAIAKFFAFALTGSIIVLASFLDSVIDSIISYINHRIHNEALKKPDAEHPFGHGGLEVIASLLQGSFLLIAGVLILTESVRMLWEPQKISITTDGIGLAMAILGISALFGYWINKFIERSKSSHLRSLALEADQVHYKLDALVQSLQVLGLLIFYLTSWKLIDPIFGVGSSIIFVAGGVHILKESITDILHTQLSPDKLLEIISTAQKVDSRVKGLHRLRARKLGPTIFIDFHLKLPAALDLETSHQIGENVAAAIEALIKNSDIMVHLDPDSEPDDEHWNPTYKNH